MSDESSGSIDSAISELETYITYNQRATFRLITYLVGVTVTSILGLLFIAFSEQLNITGIKIFIGDTTSYIVAGLFVVVFGVLMSIYRFHLNEIARASHYKFGLMRIRVAANNYDIEGFHTEVRQSLTDKAFDFSTLSGIGGKGKQVESPLPGHPSSDLSAMLLNKLLDGLEFKKK